MATDHPEGPYMLCHGLLFHKGKVIVPDDKSLHTHLLHEMHDTKTGGHSDILRTFKKLGQQFYWSGMHRSVEEYIKGCAVCQKIKINNGSSRPSTTTAHSMSGVGMTFL
jgi:hypothetical protein